MLRKKATAQASSNLSQLNDGKSKQVSRARNPSIRKSGKLFILMLCWYVVQVSYLWLKMFKIVCFRCLIVRGKNRQVPKGKYTKKEKRQRLGNNCFLFPFNQFLNSIFSRRRTSVRSGCGHRGGRTWTLRSRPKKIGF